jgi:serine protease Do
MQFGLEFSKITTRLAGVAAVAIVGLGLSGPLVAPAGAQGEPFSFADLAEGLQDAVVNISTAQRIAGTQGIPVPEVPEGSPFQEFFEEFFDRNQQGEGRRSRRVQSLGSGFVIDASGIIITNNHVIAEADEITANFADGTKLDAEVIGRDVKTDIAVLKVKTDKPLPAVPFGDSEALRVGDWVMAIGNPFGFGGTVTVGIVSALERDINSGPYDKFIQTDASINRGNSGGPLFNLQGEVIGINTAIISPSGGSIGIGFAVPTEVALPVIQQLREFGETRRGWLGVRIQEVTDEIAESLGMDKAMGALVAGVTEGGPAEASGIEPGDIIIKFDGTDVPAMRDLPRIVADTDVGKAVDVVVLRKGKRVTVAVELGRLEDGERLIAERKNGSDSADKGEPSVVLGLKLEALDAESRAKYKIGEDLVGVLVTDVKPGGAAEEKRVVPGDVIVEVSQEAVSSPAEVADRVKQLKSEGRRSALLLIAGKDNELRFVAVRIEEEEEADPAPEGEIQQQ